MYDLIPYQLISISEMGSCCIVLLLQWTNADIKTLLSVLNRRNLTLVSLENECASDCARVCACACVCVCVCVCARARARGCGCVCMFNF